MACASLLVACGSVEHFGTPAADDRAVDVWLTTGDRTRLLAPEARLDFADRPPLAANIDVDDARRYQKMAGFGAAITDASAWLIRNRMGEAQRTALLLELFGRGGRGIGLAVIRLTIGASDFSLTHYSLDDLPPGQTDPTLARFSIDAQRADVLPIVKRVLAINPNLQIVASPWSAPAWMKTTGSLIKGSLKPEHHATYAHYLSHYVDALAAEGVPIHAITLQNEPHHEPDDYPGMRLDPATRAELIGAHLGPLLARRAARVDLIEWDHNWDKPQSPLAVLSDPIARPYVAAVGWHCYGGQPSAQSRVHDVFPDKQVWLTECSGGEWDPRWPQSLTWTVRQVVIGATRAWAQGVLLWNLALDERHGPHLGGCKDCRGVVTIDSATGAITRNLEYYALAHASRFVRPGAERIDSSAGAEDL
ncbi:MAG: glycosyl hydrolase, partial [Aquincola sp.]|nr:glycosyl hydrolase [Aquincola sp.]